MRFHSVGRLFAALVGVVVLLAGAFWLGGQAPVADDDTADAIPIERDAATGSLPLLPDAEAVSLRLEPVELAPVVTPGPTLDPAPSAPLVVLGDRGRLQVADLGDGSMREARISTDAEDVVVAGSRLVIRVAGTEPGLLLVAQDLRSAVTVRHERPVVTANSVLLAGGDAVQVWAPRLRGNFVGWSGITLQVTGRGVDAVDFPRLGPPLRPVAIGGGRVLTDALGNAVMVDDDGSWTPAGRGTPVALAGDRVVRTTCEAAGCRLRVGHPRASDDGQISLPAGTMVPQSAPTVADPTGRRLAIALRDEAGRTRPAVVDLDDEQVHVLPDVLPSSSAVGGWTWSPDGRQLFMPWADKVLVWSRDGRTDILDLGDSGAILRLAMG